MLMVQAPEAGGAMSKEKCETVKKHLAKKATTRPNERDTNETDERQQTNDEGQTGDKS